MKSAAQIENDIKNTQIEISFVEREIEAYFDNGGAGFIPLVDLNKTHNLLLARLEQLEEDLWGAKLESTLEEVHTDVSEAIADLLALAGIADDASIEVSLDF
jgi:hypothetical protein